MVRIKVERRIAPTRRTSLLITLLSLASAFLVTAILLVAVGSDPLRAYSEILRIFATSEGVSESLIRGTPILFVSLGLAVAFRMNFWNIGGEGQLYMGAFAATLVGIFWESYIPSWGLLAAMFIISFAVGGLYGLLPALLRARLGVNEVLTTLMMNYIAILWVYFLVYGAWRDPKGHGFPLSPPFPSAGQLPDIPGTNVHIGLVIAIVAAALTYYLLRRTKLGFEIRVTGDSPIAAKYAGMNYLRIASLVMIIGGGLSGLAGLSIVSGMIGRLRPEISPGYGYTGIIVAWLAALNPWMIIPASVLFGGLLVAGDVLQAAVNLPFATVQVIQAVILIFVIAGDVFKHYRISIKK